jgi:hypothetical protein
MIAQVIERDAIQISPDILRVGNLPVAKLFERGDGGVLQDVGRHIRVMNAPQNQGAQARIVAIDCREMRYRIR